MPNEQGGDGLTCWQTPSPYHPTTPNKQILSEGLLMVSFSRWNYQSQTSRRRCQMHLKASKEDESIMVLPAYKGHPSIVMDTDTYRAKVSTPIENGPYQLFNKDSTDSLTHKLSEKLLTLKPSGYIYQRPLTTRSDPAL